jgi:magnesium chelatase family protein
MPGILPEMSIEESLDVTRIYSVADQLPAGTPLIQHHPFRAPHHTISHAGLVGGGNIPKPGEISLAHRGILFLDEFPEVGARVLEVMRQPMEDKVVTISRAWSLPSASGAAICRILRKQGSGKIRIGLVCVQ